MPVLELASTLSNISNPFQLPSVLVSNANHLLNKVDDLYSIVTSHEVDVVCITESWLDSSTPNTLCTIGNYEIYRKDRLCGLGGGVICYVSSAIQSYMVSPRVNVANNIDVEMIWILLKPKILP